MKPKVTLYPENRQATGAFDGGKITEIKPIPFPHEYGGSDRIGPLFYWAWASANGDGVIPMHPHQGFEIMSYVLKGEIGHKDTLGTKSRVGEGGAQVMQTGAGVSHQEEMFGERTEFFQIWFEPNLREAVRRRPAYSEHRNSDFPVEGVNGLKVKHVIGKDAPVQLVADIRFDDITIAAGERYEATLPAGRFHAAVVVEGSGTGQTGEGEESFALSKPDFAVIEATEADAKVSFTAGEEGLRVALLEAPLEVDYPLYR